MGRNSLRAITPAVKSLQSTSFMHPIIKVAVVDCQDSFVYNLVELLRNEPNCSINVLDINDVSIELAKKGAIEVVASYDALLLSPGPGLPQEQAALSDLIFAAEGRCSILGVCLGLQAIAVAYGARLQQIEKPLHGHEDHLKAVSPEEPLFAGIPSGAPIGRYHSWIVEKETFPDVLEISAISDKDSAIMALRHRKFPFHGVQFHPESFISAFGQRYISNWLALTARYHCYCNHEVRFLSL